MIPHVRLRLEDVDLFLEPLLCLLELLILPLLVIFKLLQLLRLELLELPRVLDLQHVEFVFLVGEGLLSCE